MATATATADFTTTTVDGRSLCEAPGGRGLLPEQEAAACARRVDDWGAAFRPGNAWETWLVGRMAVESTRVERCTLEERALRTQRARRAEQCWDDDRRLAAEELGERLSRRPASTRLRLERTPQGCDWLIARWTALRDGCAGEQPPDASTLARALDLLGVPHELRDGAEARLDGPTLRAEADREIARLEALRDGVRAAQDADERTLAEAGLGPEIEQAVRAVRRRETSSLRRLEWAWSQLRKGRHDHADSPPPAPPRPRREAPVNRAPEDRPWPRDPSIARLERMLTSSPVSAPVPVEASRVAVPGAPRLNRRARRALRATLLV